MRLSLAQRRKGAAVSEVQSSQGGARVRFPPPLAFAAAILAGAFLPGLRLSRGPLGVALGVAALLAGAGLIAAAVGLFRRSGQDPTPWKPSPALVIEGPFRYTRNPMYVGMTLLTLGIARLSGRGFIALFAFAALALVHFFVVLREEAYLTEKFGAPYRDYCKRVRRYV